MISDSNIQKPEISYGNTLFWVALTLTSIGLIVIYSASSMKGAVQFNDPYIFIRKQLLIALAGFLFIGLIRFIPIKWIDRSTVPLLIVTTILLASIFIPGAFVKVGGAHRWLNLGSLRFQPSELAKISLVFFLAKNLSRPNSNVQHFDLNLISNFIVFGIFGFLMMLQPDFGSTALLAGVTFFMLYAAGLPRKLIIYSGILGIISFIGAVLAAPYRMKRLLSFIDPWADITQGGFQIIQSYLGFQNGGIFGVGLGESKQKLFFLPEAHTDFILAVVGEELGLLGVLFICFLYLILVWSGFKVASKQHITFRKYLAYGFTCLIGLQATFNMGVVMGLLPTKGIPLPFMSSGASSLVVSLVVIAILSRLDQEVQLKQNE